jgi:putative N6-adenine-specific DNA methylase
MNIKQLGRPVIFASDKDPVVCRELENALKTLNLSGTVVVEQKDFFEMMPSDIKRSYNLREKGLVIINPPYGRRLGTKAQSAKLFDEIWRKLKKDFIGWQFALIAPDKHLTGKISFQVDRHAIFHGGLKLMLLTGKI